MYYKEWFQERENEIWADFFAYLSIPSISANPEHKKNQLMAADFVENRLKKIGLEVTRYEDLASPVLFGEK